MKPTNDAVLTIRKNFARPAAEVVEQFVGIPTGYVADVQGRRGALDCGIKPMFDLPPFAGPAVTVKTVPDDNLAPYAALDVLKAGDVVVITTSDWTGSPVVGDLLAAMFRNIGVIGIVTDGAVRDLAGLSEVGIPVYARGVTANAPQKNGPGSVGLDISISGVVIRSGDLIVGDRDGIVVLPQDKIPQALDGINAIKEKENKIESQIAEGMTMPDWLKEMLAGNRAQYTQ